MIQIKNLHNEKPLKPYDVLVEHSSVLCNPYHIKTEAESDFICYQYEDYFSSELKDAFLYEVERLLEIYETYGELNLFCWCAPKRCHAETIKKCILYMNGLSNKDKSLSNNISGDFDS